MLIENLRLLGKCSSRQFQAGSRQALVVDGCQQPVPDLQQRGLGAQQVGHVAQPVLETVLGDAQAFFGHRDGCPGHFDALLRRLEAGVGPAHLEVYQGIGLVLLGPRAVQRVAGLLDAGLVRKSVENVSAQCGAADPVGAAPREEALAVGLEAGVEGHLGPQRGPR